ncbi:MAG TPA: FAD-binding oxidoreductase [Streptosporangiaceae bacterium]|nr:FAD-binding oxidoreductase [Streptosporangiaceae bacterium]
MAADPVLAALAAACPAARPAQPGDAVAGVMPRFAASPATVAEASELLRAAAAHDLAVVPRGGSSKLGWGAPPRRVDLLVDTSGLDRVVEHAAGDLVVRVQAGVSLARLGEVLAGAGQRLALDPPPCPAPQSPVDGAAPAWPGATVGGTLATGATPSAAAAAPPTGGATPSAWLGATVGGTLATGAAGPRRLRYGTPRDLLIGITVVRADGTVARSGGKVVKNVAGYDLGKLFTGSFGTLGLIVEAVFRLHPRPASAAYVTVDCDGPDEAYWAVATAAGSELAPSAIELDRPARDQPVRVAVLLEGDPDGTATRTGLMSTLLGRGAATQPSAPGWWGWPANGRSSNGQSGDGRSGNGQPSDERSGAGQPGGAAGTDSPPSAAGTEQPGTGPGAGQQAGVADAGQAGTLIRIGFWAAGLPQVLRTVDAAALAAGLDPAVGGSAAAGVIYAAVGPDADPAAVAAFVSGLREALARGDGDARPASAPVPDGPPVLASAVVVHAPPRARDLMDLWGPVPSLSLMRAVKDQFDPGHRMAPGRFAGGI